MDYRPVGIFDSGMGGLTSVRVLRELLPGEDIAYLGDTARVPYGGRSVEELIAVEGIGEGKLEKLRELVTVEEEP